MKNFLHKVFGGLNITWPRLIAFAVVMGVYTALMAMLVPDGNSFHDIAVTPEWWVLPAILIIVNSKKPLDAALRTFVFFLISQPLVYLVQVPFNEMGWGLFGYYKYWFIVTLFTFPAGFVGWYVKKDKWYSGLILSVMTVFLALTGYFYATGFSTNFPNHLISTIYCFGIIPVFIFGIFKNKQPRIITAVITIVAVIITFFVAGTAKPFETYMNSFIEENDIIFVGEPYISFYTGDGQGNIEIITIEEGVYNFKLNGLKGKNYNFTVSDDENNYSFRYYYDSDRDTVIVEKE